MEYLIVIALMLVLSAFFSGMEIAYVSSNKIHIEIEKKQNNFISGILHRITKRPSKFIATMLVGNNIALVVYGFYMGDLLIEYIPVIGFTGILVQTIISTVIILITAEFLPKVFFQIYANSLVKIFAIPAYLFYLLFSVISEFVIWISDMVLKVFFRTEGDTIQLTFSKIELGNYISEQMETAETRDNIDSEVQIFQNALDFSEIKSREVMIPRTEMIAVDIHTSLKDLRKLFTDTGLSKILVFNENVDDILGYVNAFELFKRPKTIKSILLPVELVPESMMISDLLNLLTKKRKSVAVVIDEYGGTSGIITVEDIVEELFGEIEDEHDVQEFREEVLGDHEFNFSARLEVDYVNETYNLSIPKSEAYSTLGGFIINHTEDIPEENEELEIENFKIKILKTSGSKIDEINLNAFHLED